MSKDRSPLLDCSMTMGTSCIASRIGELQIFQGFCHETRPRQAASIDGGLLLFAAALGIRSNLRSVSSWTIRKLVPPVAFGVILNVTVLSRNGGVLSRIV